MELSLAGRNVICLVAIPPQAFDLDGFEAAIGARRPETQLTSPQATLVQYPELQLLIAGGRAQLEFPPTASREMVERATQQLLLSLQPYRPNGVGFNGIMLAIPSEQEDPLGGVVASAAIGERLGTDGVRSGIKLVFDRDGATWTLSVDPPAAIGDPWTCSINRHHSEIPTEDVLRGALTWFASLDHELRVLLLRLAGTEQENA